ncbi:MAG: hypothetical protein FWB78_12010, partial [Treponema sp.]|nr:hypothetical protein [Treponema sp.]
QKNANENEMKLAVFDCLTNVLAEREMPKQQPIPTPPRETTEARIITSQEFDELRNAGNRRTGKNFMQGELFQPSIPNW